MKSIFKSEGVIALTFLCAGIVLLVSSFGVLTIPGLIMSLLGIILIFKKRYVLASAVGIMTATGSYVGQLVTVFCPGCSLSATLFAIAGILSLILIVNDKPIYILLTVPLVISGLVLGTTFIPEDTRPMVYIASAQADNGVSSKASNAENKPQLFFSVTCSSCEEVVKTYVEKDPTGESWQPIVVPQITLAKGEEKLKKLGYTGLVYSAPNSPSGMVPCLLADNKLYSGKGKALTQLENLEGGESE